MYNSISNEKKWYCLSATDYHSGETPDIEYMVDNGSFKAALSDEEAAKEFAEEYQRKNLWYPEQMTVFVMDEEEKKIYRYVVYMRMDPYYYVRINPIVSDAVHQEE